MKDLNINFDLNKEQKESLYYQALIISFKQFLKEEQLGNINTELRLVSKIKSARELYQYS